MAAPPGGAPSGGGGRRVAPPPSGVGSARVPSAPPGGGSSSCGQQGDMTVGVTGPAVSGAGGEEPLDHWNRNPLLCWICDELYDDPCILACYHTFCARCLSPRVMEGKIFCPLCG